LKKGLIKLIGDDTSTQVWIDPWIPGIPGFKPLYKKSEATVERFHELLTLEGSAWNEQVLQENFVEADVKEI
jgi:hypothetical protein